MGMVPGGLAQCFRTHVHERWPAGPSGSAGVRRAPAQQAEGGRSGNGRLQGLDLIQVYEES